MSSDEIRIVAFEESDLDQMMEIEVRVFPTPWSRESYLELAPLSTIDIWVAKMDEELVGYMLYQFCEDEMELHSIAVKPELQRTGVGTALMDHMLLQASLKGINRIFLLVRPSNIAARMLYEKYGFELVGLRQHYYQDNNESALILCREEGTIRDA